MSEPRDLPPRPAPHLAAWLRSRRAELGLSQRAVARLAGISQSSISALERGAVRVPSLRLLSALQRALGADEHEIFTAAGLGAPAAPYRAGDQELRVLAVYRTLDPADQRLVLELARFLASRGPRWEQPPLLPDLDEGTRPPQTGPTLFDVLEAEGSSDS